MKLMSSPRFLMFYSAFLTLVLAVIAFAGFAAQSHGTQIDEITVHRINIVEPDGTLRMVISNKTAFPGVIVKGKEYPHPDRDSAGMIFFNDEGTENGGLIFGGSRTKDGVAHSYGHLSFDRYQQDQTFTVDASEDGDKRESKLALWDRPDYPITDILSLPRDDWQKFIATHPKAQPRLYLGRSDDRSVSLKLKDPDGRDRIVIKVGADGAPVIQFLDQAGKIVRQLPEPAKN